MGAGFRGCCNVSAERRYPFIGSAVGQAIALVL